jgi:apolipoprotein N-acyltransferase
VAGVLGELGVSLLVAWLNVLVAVTGMAWRGEFPTLGRAVLHRYWGPVALAVLLASTTLYGLRTVRNLERVDPAAPSLSVAVIQGDVDLDDKWDPAERDSTFVPYTRLTELAGAQGARLAIWPETAIPMDLMRSPRYLEWVQATMQRSSAYLLTGLPERQVTPEGKVIAYNSSLLMDDTGAVRSYYRKMHLLPFGERMPLQWLIPALGRVEMGQAEWAIGPEMTVMEVDGVRFCNLICFESIFPDLGRLAVRRGAEFLVNMSNDGWFGNTLAPYQHGLMAAMRAAENRVPLVRVANNGISFFALPTGRIVQQTHLFQRTIQLRTLRPSAPVAPYTRYGDVPLFLLMAATCIFLWAVGRRRA